MKLQWVLLGLVVLMGTPSFAGAETKYMCKVNILAEDPLYATPQRIGTAFGSGFFDGRLFSQANLNHATLFVNEVGSWRSQDHGGVVAAKRALTQTCNTISLYSDQAEAAGAPRYHCDFFNDPICYTE